MDLPSPASAIIPLGSSQSLLNQARQGAATSSASGSSAAQTAIQKVGQEFESMFISEMLKPMFEGLKTDELGGGGAGEEAFRPLLIDEYAKALSKSGGLGIAQAVVRELMQVQSGHAATPATPTAPLPTQSQQQPIAIHQEAGHDPHRE